MKLKHILLAVIIILLGYISLIIHPNPLFKFDYTYKNINVHSDHEILTEIKDVLELALLNLKSSELYDDSFNFNIYICHSEKLFSFLTRNPNAGANVQGILSPNVFIRSVDILKNKINPPKSWKYDLKDRPLSYFIAHELTHSLQAKHNRFMILKCPNHIMEGYADYIGKMDSFIFEDYKKQLSNNDPKMSFESPLYNKYHLYIAYLIDIKKMKFKEILQKQPNFEETLNEILQL